jgi:hypothetical protein
MKMLASRIAKELEKSKHCGISEPELSRIWPDYGKPREPQIGLFAEQHGPRTQRDGTDAGPVSGIGEHIQRPTDVPFVECKSLSR